MNFIWMLEKGVKNYSKVTKMCLKRKIYLNPSSLINLCRLRWSTLFVIYSIRMSIEMFERKRIEIGWRLMIFSLCYRNFGCWTTNNKNYFRIVFVRDCWLNWIDQDINLFGTRGRFHDERISSPEIWTAFIN